jgi:hypothetical protein
MRPLWIQDTCFFQMACKPGTRTEETPRIGQIPGA